MNTLFWSKVRQRVRKGTIVLTLTGLLLGSPAQALMATQGPQKAYAGQSQESKADTAPRIQPTLYAQAFGVFGSFVQAIMAIELPQKTTAAEPQESKKDADKTKPYIGKISPYKVTKLSQPTVFAQVWDKGVGLDLSKTHVVIDGKRLPGKVSPKGVFKEQIPKKLSNGWHFVAVKAWDKAKNYTQTNWSFEVDATKPYIGKVSPYNPINRRQPTLYAEVWDKGVGLDLSKTHVVIDGKRLSGKVSSKGMFKQRVPDYLDVGWHFVAVKAWDKAGNYSQTDWSFEVRGHKVKSAKYQSSRKGHKPKVIVLHSTIGTYPGDYRTLMGGAKVSAHFYVRKSGYIVRLVPDRIAAWHAGRSSFKGIGTDGSLNAESLGIEIESKGRGPGDYTKAQIEAVAEIVKNWQKKYGISDKYVTGHSGITRRKSDPKGFPWGDFWNRVHSLK